MRNFMNPVTANVMRMIGLVTGLTGTAITVAKVTERPWASITFAGLRYTLLVHVRVDGAAALLQLLERLIPALPEAELSIKGQMVADAHAEILCMGENAEGHFAELEVTILTVRE